MKYAFIAAHRGAWAVDLLCGVLGVARSGYYAWARRGPSLRRLVDSSLAVQVRRLHGVSRGSYGSRRMQRELRAAGLPYGRHRIARVMREAGVRGKQGKRFRVVRTAPPATVAPHRLQRQFHCATTAAELNRRWVTDATVLHTAEGWLHLVAILDVGSRHVVGWAASPRLDEQLACMALDVALTTRRPSPGLLVHSDQGSPFVSHRFQQRLARAGATASMSRRGNCWDNAVIESFFHTLKDERRDDLQAASYPAARAILFHFIEHWYNRERLHSTLKYLSPTTYERALHQRYRSPT